MNRTYNTADIIKKLAKIVERTCRRKTNYFGYGAWSHHIVSVVKYAKILARKLKADEEICEIAALLHDYASVLKKEWYPQHHIHSARLAEKLLSKYNYPPEKIEKVKRCILTHRASKGLSQRTLEAKILASADALAHFDNVHSLLYLAFVRHRMGIDEGTEWVLNKLKRSWRKLMPEAKELIKDKYEAIKLALT